MSHSMGEPALDRWRSSWADIIHKVSSVCNSIKP